MGSKHELYTIKIPREIEVEIVSDTEEPRKIANELWYRVTEGSDLDESLSVVKRLCDNCTIEIIDDYISDDEVNMPMKLSGEVRWLPLGDVPRSGYYDGIIDSQTDFVRTSTTTEVLLQGDAVLSVIHCDNNVWIGDVYVNERAHFERNHKKSLRDQIDRYVKNYLYPY